MTGAGERAARPAICGQGRAGATCISAGPARRRAHCSGDCHVTMRTYASVSRGRPRRPASQPRTRPGPALYAAAASPRFPNSRRRSRKSFAEWAIASIGSKGSARPRAFAVAGMNCATPCAPARLTAVGSKRLSCQISRAKKSTGRSFSPAAAASASQMLATEAAPFDGVAGGDWVLSTGATGSGSPALACPTSWLGSPGPSAAASNMREKRADAMRPCMRVSGESTYGMSALLRMRTPQAFLAMSVERQHPDLEAIARVDRHALRPANRSTPCRLIAASRGSSRSGRRRDRRCERWRHVRKPCRIQDLPRHLLIDMGRDFAVKRIGERVVFESAAWRAVWRQISVLGQIGERHRVGAVGQAHEIIKAFFRLAVVAGKARQLRLHDGIRPVIGDVHPPSPGAAGDQSPRSLLAELQHDVSRKVVGGIFRMSEYRHFENIVHCVSDLVGREPEELPDCRIPRRDSAGGRLLWQGLQYVPQKLVTDGHRRFGILSAVPGIHHAAFRGFDGQLLRQTKRTQYPLHILEHTVLP